MEQLAKALRDEMARRQHSYRGAATAMGVSSGSVVNWSKGWIEESPRLRNLEALAKYLGVDFFVVLGYVGVLTESQVADLIEAKGVYIGSPVRVLPGSVALIAS